MFASVYASSATPAQFLLMALASILSGVLFSWLMSLRVHARSRFFIVTSLMPFVVGSVLTFVSGSIGAGVAFGGAFALIRFRSAPGTSDEIAAILISAAAGVAFGMGYIAYGVLILAALGLLYVALSSVPLFSHASLQEDRLLTVTIPESLDYTREFGEIFSRYLSSVENVGVKTTGMGSMFRLSFRVRLRNRSEEKALIDELRTRNGNLEIALLPYTESLVTL